MKDLDRAIQQCLESAANTSQRSKDEYIQLAEWLIELKVRRMIQMPPMYSIQTPIDSIPVSIQPYESTT